MHKGLKPFTGEWEMPDGSTCDKGCVSEADLKKHITAVHRKKKPFA